MDTNSKPLNLIEAEGLLSLTYWMAKSRWKIIENLRRVAQAGLPLASRVIKETEQADLWHPQLFTSSDIRTALKLNDAEYAVDAACLIFAHSIVDVTLYKYCVVTARAAPDDWQGWVKKEQVAMGELQQKGLEAVFEEVLQKHLSGALHKISLTDKADRILAICQLGPGWLPKELNGTFRYDRMRLKRLDRQRHDIIHGSQRTLSLGAMDDELAFLLNTLTYFCRMIEQRYGLKQSASYVIKHLLAKDTSPQ